MALPFHTHTATIKSKVATTDAYGDKQVDPRTGATTRTAGCVFFTDASTDAKTDSDRKGRRETAGSVWFEPEEQILPDDVIVIDGLDYAVNGRPMLRTAQFTGLDHVEVGVSLIRG